MQLIHDSDISHLFLSLYPSVWLLFSYLLSQGPKTTSPPPAWCLLSSLEEKQERDKENGAGPITNSSILYMHLIGQKCITWSPSASREAEKSRLECNPDSNEERERTTLLARLQMVSATPGVPSWASYLISLGIYVRLWKMRIKIPTS